VVEVVDVDSVELVFVEFDGVLEDAQGEVGAVLVVSDFQFVDQDEYLSQVGFVLVVVARKFLVDLLGDLAEIA
jgi:hypothetical protein